MKDMSRRFFWIETVNLFLAVLLPLFLLGIVAGMLTMRVLNEEINKSFAAGVGHAVDQLNGVASDLERLNYSLTTNPAVTLRLKTAMKHASEEGIHDDEFAVYNAILDLIYASCRQNPYVDSSYIYYEDGGDFFISSKKRLTNLSESTDIGWYQSYLNAGMFERTWNETRMVTQEDGSQRELMTIYCRIFAGGTTGSDRGVLVLNIDESRIAQLLESPDDKWETSACVVDEAGRLLFESSDIGQVPDAQALGTGVRNQFGDDWNRDGIQKKRITMRDGKKYVCLTEKLPHFGWHLIWLAPESSLYAVSRRVLNILIAAIGLTMLFGIFFAYQTAQRNNRDIAGVIHSIQRAKRGLIANDEENGTDGRLTYSQTLRNVVDTFLDKEYLQMQLADRRHHAKLLELQALQAQLNPHFLFNTMSTIQWKTIALTGGRNDASDMIEYLSDMLHYALDASEEIVTIRREMEILDSYIAIQKIRYGERFDYICECEEETKDRQVVKLLLQPLVENSIHHGLSEEGQTLTVRTRITMENGLLCILVEDNGVGMDAARLAYVRESLSSSKTERGRHIGLYNVNKRMMLSYGDNYRLEIDSAPGKGTSILLRLPVIDQLKTSAEAEKEERT
ncbi:MAG: sensor histidine kinase [Clostridiales bacterium]|nr:sensor histidine kinase [Clostridiales bacterium]